MTKSQKEALDWLIEHNGDGMFDKNGVLLAAGESGPHRRVTWNALRNLGKVEFYKPAGGKATRVRVIGGAE